MSVRPCLVSDFSLVVEDLIVLLRLKLKAEVLVNVVHLLLVKFRIVLPDVLVALRFPRLLLAHLNLLVAHQLFVLVLLVQLLQLFQLAAQFFDELRVFLRLRGVEAHDLAAFELHVD